MTKESALEIKNSYRKSLEGGETVAKSLSNHSNNELWFDWTEYLDNLWWTKLTQLLIKKMKKIGTNMKFRILLISESGIKIFLMKRKNE